MTNIPWVDKYRPRKLENIVQQSEVISSLMHTAKTGDMGHMLFYGPPGTGKTSTAFALAYTLFGPKILDDRVIELNASDDRGIGVVRDKIITFAKMKIGNSDPNYPCPEFKIIILDEADAMTTEAQSALRQIIETSSGITRFIFICNYINKIIEPLASRCIKFRFEPIGKDLMKDKLRFISDRENISINNSALELISSISNGDVRRAIMTLQYVKYLNKIKDVIDVNDIKYITAIVDDKLIDDIMKICCLNEINIVKIHEMAKNIQRNAYFVIGILNKIKDRIKIKEISDYIKAKIMIELSNTESKILDGGNEYLQTLNILTTIANIMTDKKEHKPILSIVNVNKEKINKK